MGGDSHGRPYEIPDYKSYKVENVPELERIQNMLAQKGLKDPWLRNEVWRFDPKWGTTRSRFNSFFFRGFRVGFGLFVATILLEKVLSQGKDSGHH